MTGGYWIDTAHEFFNTSAKKNELKIFQRNQLGVIQYLLKQVEVGGWSIVYVYKLNDSFYLLCLFTRGR